MCCHQSPVVPRHLQIRQGPIHCIQPALQGHWYKIETYILTLSCERYILKCAVCEQLSVSAQGNNDVFKITFLHRLTQPELHLLWRDAARAKQSLMFLVEVKLGFWMAAPHSIVGLGHADLQLARALGKQTHHEFLAAQAMGKRQHPLLERFFGSSSPLRCDTMDFLNGSAPSDALMQERARFKFLGPWTQEILPKVCLSLSLSLFDLCV